MSCQDKVVVLQYSYMPQNYQSSIFLVGMGGWVALLHLLIGDADCFVCLCRGFWIFEFLNFWMYDSYSFF